MGERGLAEDWRLARYQLGDEPAILELFTTVFGRARSLEHWRWQFRDNPYGGPFVSLARRVGDGSVVGSYSVMPIQINYCGRPVLACQSVDTAVHPAFRGQRIFEKTASDCYAWCAEAGLAAVIGFPNANSYPGFTRNLEWKRIVYPTQHVLRLSAANGLRRFFGTAAVAEIVDVPYRLGVGVRLAARRGVTRRVAGRGLRYRIADNAPPAYEGFWNGWRSQEYLSLWKDTAYLAWRYDRNPDQRFRYHLLERDGEIRALAISTEIDGALVLCELMIGGHDVEVGRVLVAEICTEAISRGLRAVRYLGHDSGVSRDALAGFEHRTSYTNVFGGRAFAQGVLGETLPHADNWSISFGDGDFV